jgi:GntR family transcriptional regulator/MocR family aminotransferase
MISTDDGTPRYQQISARIRAQIADGSLAAGARLPASRALAQDLGVARTTVVAAYDQLTAEGYLEARRGAGVFVCDVAPISPPAAPAAAAPDPAPARCLHLEPGKADPEVFPTLPWARCVARVARNAPRALVFLDDPFGDPALRAEIAAYAGRWRGITASADQVIVTNGASEALEMAMTLLVRKGSVALEAPGYSPLFRLIRQRGWTPQWLRPGPQGYAPLPASVTVLTPSHQFPLGGTLPVPARQAFLRAAAEHDGWIIEDDFDSEFRYAGRPVPAMAALDEAGRCVYVGTFSKTFSHALRLGYLILPPALVSKFRAAMRHPSGGAPVSAQRPMAEFMASGQYDRHIRRARRLYAQRYKAAADAIAQWPGRLGRFQRHEAGMQITFHLPPEAEDKAIAAEAEAQGLGIKPLSAFDPEGQMRGLLIGFCQSPPEDIPPLLEHLRSLLEARQDSAQ